MIQIDPDIHVMRVRLAFYRVSSDGRLHDLTKAKVENWLRHNYVSVCDKTFWTKPKTTDPGFPGSNLFSLKTHWRK